MPEDANKLIVENLNKNIVDLDEYPAAAVIHNRCVSMRKFVKEAQTIWLILFLLVWRITSCRFVEST